MVFSPTNEIIGRGQCRDPSLGILGFAEDLLPQDDGGWGFGQGCTSEDARAYIGSSNFHKWPRFVGLIVM